MLAELITEIKKYSPNSDYSLLEKAYHFAEDAHSKQLRASGDKYFSHCVNVAQILIGLKLDVPTIAAALLHDVLEDTDVTIDILKKEFNDEIASLVEGVTKIGSYKFNDPEIAQAENWRKMLLAVTKDIRVILVKLADRLHNLRTIKYLPPDKQKNIANESVNLYAPFAQRLGIYKWKSEIEKDMVKIHPDETLGELVEKISSSKRNIFPVVDNEGFLQGVVLLDNVRDIMFNSGMYDSTYVRDLMIMPPAQLSIGDTMEIVMKRFEETGAWNLPVTEDGKYIGFISKSKIFTAYRELLIQVSED